MSMRSTIESLFQEVANDQERKLAPLSDDLTLAECGLDSLSFAIVVARLEDEFDVDPFSTGEAIEFPVTFGDFVAMYES